VVATGGKGEFYHREIEAIELYDPDLTLKGLEICRRRSGHGGQSAGKNIGQRLPHSLPDDPGTSQTFPRASPL
jgi:hypothetical protein